MALSLESLRAQRERILSEMGGDQQVQFADRSVTRRPQAELEAALARIDREIAGLQSPQPSTFVITGKRGI